MKTRTGLLAAIACFAILLHHPSDLIAVGDNAVALTGQVTSAEEGPMEGVLVSARRAGSTVTTTVVSDRQGRYQFPRARLEPGDYTLRIRAIGYDLERAPSVTIARGQAGDRRPEALEGAATSPSQLTNAEWLASMPGTAEQKASVRGCAHCHTLELVTRSRHDANAVRRASIERMAGYPPLVVPADAAEDAGAADRRRRGAGRAAAAGAAPSGRVSEHAST